MVEKIGTNGDDKIAGSSKDDVIISGDGNDIINSGAGDDLVIAGDGNNKIEAGTGNDTIITGNGNNLVAGGDGNDVIITGDGNDTIAGDAGDDIITGGGGADTFQFKAGFGNDVITDLNFGEGDKINIYAGTLGAAQTKNITLTSKGDIDALVASGIATLTINSVNGSAVLAFTGVSDTITLIGYDTASSPNTAGTSADNVILGNNTTGPISSTYDAAHLTGGKGNDALLAAPVNTLSEGGQGDDLVVGGAGADRLTGNAGDDVLAGGRGNDQINGAGGNDILSGGSGADKFSFVGSFGNDIVTDFNFAEGDFLNFGGANITSAAQLNAFVSSHGGIVTNDAVSTTLTLGTDSIRFIGVSSTGGIFN